MDTDASTMSVSHKTYPRRCVCARIYEFAMDSRVSIGLWTKELGPIAFAVDSQAIGALHGNLKDAERLLRQKIGRA
jgi:hypothetical protein